jgi:hypothetical protein
MKPAKVTPINGNGAGKKPTAASEAQELLREFAGTIGGVLDNAAALRSLEERLRAAMAAIAAERGSYSQGFDAGYASGFEAGVADALRSAAPAAGANGSATVAQKFAKARGTVPARRRRAVVLVDGTGKDARRDIDRCAVYCATRGLTMTHVARRVDDAAQIIISGDADVLVCLSAMPLYPLVQILTLAGEETDRQRRTQRVHRLYPPEDLATGPNRPVDTVNPGQRRVRLLYPRDDPGKRRPRWRGDEDRG